MLVREPASLWSPNVPHFFQKFFYTVIPQTGKTGLDNRHREECHGEGNMIEGMLLVQ